MTSKNARRILETMMYGIDPITGEVLPKEHLCNYPEVIRALHAAIMVMTDGCSLDEKQILCKKDGLNAGRPWTEEDLNELEQLYRDGTPINVICKQLQRRERGVQRQLIYLGFIKNDSKQNGEVIPGLEKAGLPWTRAEEDLLKNLYIERMPIAEIAKTMQRSKFSIFRRMEKLGLYGEEYGYPAETTLLKI